MARFAVPTLAQDKVLYIGIVVSMLLRAVFILAGAAAISAASWVFYIFGAFLVYTAIRLAIEGENDESQEFQENVVHPRPAPDPAAAATTTTAPSWSTRDPPAAGCSPRW